MRKQFVLFLTLALLIFGGTHYYIGLRGWQWLLSLAPHANGWIYWLVFIALALTFPLSRFTARRPGPLSHAITVIGAVWLAVFQFALPLLVIADLAALVNRWLGLVPAGPAAVRVTGTLVFGLLVVLIVYGTWRARTPVVVRYEGEVAKSGGPRKELHVVLVSDTHFGAAVGNRQLRAMVETVNSLNPDLILHAGDLVDDHLGPFVAKGMPEELRRLKAPLGVYSILGNHDIMGGNLPEYRRQTERAGIRLLVDETVLVDNSLYIIGRDDISRQRMAGHPRKPLAELLQGVDPSLPLILMDHQPYRLEEAQQAGIDLQVSGHTHRGQIFPYHLITRKVFELDWGYLYKPPTHVVVSLGYGTWGPPVRLGNRPEVVSIRLRFAEH